MCSPKIAALPGIACIESQSYSPKHERSARALQSAADSHLWHQWVQCPRCGRHWLVNFEFGAHGYARIFIHNRWVCGVRDFIKGFVNGCRVYWWLVWKRLSWASHKMARCLQIIFFATPSSIAESNMERCPVDLAACGDPWHCWLAACHCWPAVWSSSEFIFCTWAVSTSSNAFEKTSGMSKAWTLCAPIFVASSLNLLARYRKEW